MQNLGHSGSFQWSAPIDTGSGKGPIRGFQCRSIRVLCRQVWALVRADQCQSEPVLLPVSSPVTGAIH